MPIINGVYLKDFPALPSAVADANIIPIAISGNQIAYRTTVSGIVTDARVTSKLLTGLSVTGGAISATDTILEAFGKVQNQINGKQDTITLTTIGTSGAATFIANTLNIPNYADGGVLSLSAIGATPNANAATITGTVLNLEPASASFGGVVTTGAQTFAGDKTLTGALVGTTGSFASSGGSDSFAINHSSGAGIALNITKGGNGEGIYVNKTSGSGNAATIIGTLNATTLVKSGGTSSQFLKADGTVDSTAYGTGTVTSVAALTLGTSGTDLSSTVANGSTTPVITLNVPDASATARGVVTTGMQTFAGDKTLSGTTKLTGNVTFSAGQTVTFNGTTNLNGANTADSEFGINRPVLASTNQLGFRTGGNLGWRIGNTLIGSNSFNIDSYQTGSGVTALAIDYTTLAVTSAGSISSTPQGTLYGTATGSITSAQLATSLTDETGTGSAVFSASPTFTGTVNAAAVTLTGALSGTSASFSSGISVGGATATTGGIQFPATAVAIADANNLDDYEEGTWTPGLSAGTSGTISVNTGNSKASYTKIGRAVTLQAYILVSSVSSPVGRLSVTGFPFTVGSNLGDAVTCVYNVGFTGNPGGWPILRVQPGTTALIDIQEGDGTNPAIDLSDHITTNTELVFSITYFV